MFTMTCKCGKTSKSFKYLNRSSFPEEWIQPCCKESMKKEVAPAPKKEEVIEKVEKKEPKKASRRNSKKEQAIEKIEEKEVAPKIED